MRGAAPAGAVLEAAAHQAGGSRGAEALHATLPREEIGQLAEALAMYALPITRQHRVVSMAGLFAVKLVDRDEVPLEVVGRGERLRAQEAVEGLLPRVRALVNLSRAAVAERLGAPGAAEEI